MGAEFLTAARGALGVRGYYYEVELVEAKGYLIVGFAGTNIGPLCSIVGDDACSWSIDMNAYKRHRRVGWSWGLWASREGVRGRLRWLREVRRGRR